MASVPIVLGARSHEECRQAVCCVCGKKPKEYKGTKVKKTIKVVSDKQRDMVKQFINPSYSPNNGWHPTALCLSCNTTLLAYQKNPYSPGRKLPPFLNYESLVPPPPLTRSSADSPCMCTICEIARLKCEDYKKYAGEQSNPVGAPAKHPQSPPGQPITVCSKCLSLFAPGKSHICLKTTKRDNLSEMVRQSSDKSKSTVTVSTLKTMAEDQGVSTKGGTVMLKSGSKVLPVQIGSSRVKAVQGRFSHGSLMRLQVALNLSDNTLKKVAGAIRVVSGRNSVEPNLASALKERNHMLDSMFFSKVLNLTGDDNDKIGVFCSDLDKLVSDMISHRNIDPVTSDVKVGIDGGQGMLKVGMTISDRDNTEHVGRSHYSSGVACRQGKDSSVKKLVLLGVVPDIPENYESVKLILETLNIEAVDYMTSGDIKMLMILAGKSGGKPKYGCPFCSSCTPYEEDGELYCVQDLLELHREYVEAGSVRKNQMRYQNVVNPPLITGDLVKLVLGLLAIPELHLLIGVVDKLITGLENNLFLTKEEGRQLMDDFLKKMAIVRKSYQGAHSLEGNQSRAFLKKADQLELVLGEHGEDVLQKGLPFVHAIRAFSEVVGSCFGGSLTDDYQDKIKEFRGVYMNLGISVTPKVHIVFQHISEFLTMVNQDESQEPKGLGYFSEQAFEAMHYDAKLQWERVKVNQDHPDFAEKLKSFIVSYNSKHM